MNSWKGDVQASLFLGSHTEHVIRVGDDIDFLVWSPDPRLIEEHAELWLNVSRTDARALPMEDIGADDEHDGATGFAS